MCIQTKTIIRSTYVIKKNQIICFLYPAVAPNEATGAVCWIGVLDVPKLKLAILLLLIFLSTKDINKIITQWI